MNLHEYRQNRIMPQKVILYGEPKTGRTTLIGTLATAGYKLIYFDLENGAGTLAKLSQNALENIQYIPIHDTPDKPTGHNTIDRIVRGGEFQICLEHGAVSCIECKGLGIAGYQKVIIPTRFTPEFERTIIVIESGTQLSQSITNTILKGKDPTYQESLHDYRNNGNYLNRIFGYIQNSKYHCIITAHVVEAEQEDKTVKLCPLIGTRSYAVNINKIFDHVVYCFKQNGKHRAASSTTFANNIQTGSRSDIVLEKDSEPSLVPMFDSTVQQVVQPKATAILNETITLAKSLI